MLGQRTGWSSTIRTCCGQGVLLKRLDRVFDGCLRSLGETVYCLCRGVVCDNSAHPCSVFKNIINPVYIITIVSLRLSNKTVSEIKSI